MAARLLTMAAVVLTVGGGGGLEAAEICMVACIGAESGGDDGCEGVVGGDACSGGIASHLVVGMGSGIGEGVVTDGGGGGGEMYLVAG